MAKRGTPPPGRNGRGRDREESGPPVVDVAIVGGGIAGLAAAFELARAAEASGQPIRFCVIEAADAPGGKLKTDYVDGFIVEQAPDSFLVRKPEARQLCLDLGLGDALVPVNPAARGAAILHRGRLVPMPESMVLVAPTRVLPFATTPLLSPLGKLRAALDLVLPARSADGDESVESLVRRRFGAEIAERLAVPLLGGVYGGGSGDISVEATFPELQRLEQRYRSVLLGLRAIERQRRGKPPGPLFQALRGGFATLAQAIVARLPAGSFRSATSVERIERLAVGSSGRYLIRTSRGSVVAQSLVLATPAPVTASLLAELAPAVSGELRGIEYSPSLVVALAFPAGAVTGELYGTGFLVPAAARSSLAACTYVHRKWPHTTPRGNALFRCFLNGPAPAALLDRDDADLVQLVRRELDPLIGSRGAPSHSRVYRWPIGTPRYAPGHLQRVARIESALAGLPGLIVTGASLRGLGVPDCIRQGQAAARIALESLAAPDRGVERLATTDRADG